MVLLFLKKDYNSNRLGWNRIRMDGTCILSGYCVWKVMLFFGFHEGE